MFLVRIILKIEKSDNRKEDIESNNTPNWYSGNLVQCQHDPVSTPPKYFIVWLGLPQNSVDQRNKEISVGKPLARFQLSSSDFVLVYIWIICTVIGEFIE